MDRFGLSVSHGDVVAKASDDTPKNHERKLWSRVLILGLQDIRELNAESDHLLASDLRRWLRKPEACIGSFRWICHVLGFNGDKLRRNLLRKVQEWPKMKTSLPN